MKKSLGSLVITLDYEKVWGVFDVLSLNEFKDKASLVDSVVIKLVKLADKYNVLLTFNIVGLLFSEDFEDAERFIPSTKPKYCNSSLDAYKFYDDNKVCHTDIKPFFSFDTIAKLSHSNHEIGTHTFSHFYCKEPEQTLEEFSADLNAAISIARENHGINVRSIVFPRNQVNSNYLSTCFNHGIRTYRGVENSFLYKERSGTYHNVFVRFLRLIDAYFNLTGFNISEVGLHESGLVNVPGSRLFRPYNPALRMLEEIKIKRIKNSMEFAAKNNEVFHLWFHPHNIINNQDQNFVQLEIIFKHFSYLQRKYNMQSVTLNSFQNAFN